MKIEKLPITALVKNEGQIDGIPSNPRQWTKADVEKIAKSLKETPELFEMRPCLVYEQDGKYIVLGGNLRLEGALKNKDKEVPCIVVPKETPTDKLKEIVIKDNGSFGKWDFDALANEWDDLPLEDWGIDLPNMTKTEQLSKIELNSVYYVPSEIPTLKLQDCVNMDKFNAKIKAIEESNLSDVMKETMKIFAYRFIKIDFEAVANYYTFNASEEEKRIIERLRLVLVDDGLQGGGYIEDEMLKIANIGLDNFELTIHNE